MIRRFMPFVLIILLSASAYAQMKTTRTAMDQGTSTAAATTSQCTNVTLTGLFPTDHSSTAAECFWDQDGFQILRSAEMTASNGSVAATMDMMSDFFYGWRITFTTAVASQGDSDDDSGTGATGTGSGSGSDNDTASINTAANLLRANGGNLALSAAYPLYAKKWGGASTGTGGFTAITYGRIAGMFDAFGNATAEVENLDFNSLNANAEWSVTTATKLVTVSDVFNFEVYTNAGLLAGTKTFRNAVGIKDDDSGVFVHGEVGANVKISGKMLVGVSWNYYSADGLDGGATLTVGFTR